jgi:hypothetical protein
MDKPHDTAEVVDTPGQPNEVLTREFEAALTAFGADLSHYIASSAGDTWEEAGKLVHVCAELIRKYPSFVGRIDGLVMQIITDAVRRKEFMDLVNSQVTNCRDNLESLARVSHHNLMPYCWE